VSELLPPPNPARIAATPPRRAEKVQLAAGTTLLRIHPLNGPYRTTWNQFRSFGPTGSRFDHHPSPPRLHSTRAVMYCTTGSDAFITAVAEYFQDDAGGVAPLDRRVHHPNAAAFRLAAPMTLLDLSSGWVTRAGGNQAIVSGRRSTARAWARAVYDTHTDLDGVLYPSSIWGPGRCVALWERGVDAVPATPQLHRSLADPALDAPLADAAERLGTLLIG